MRFSDRTNACAQSGAWLAILVFTATTGCVRSSAPVTHQSPSAAPAGPDPGAGVRTLTSANNSFIVAYRVQPNPIPLNEPFSIDVQVYGANQRTRLLKDILLEVDGRMPHHRHGMIRQPKVTVKGDGTFTVVGMLFHMPGRWELYFDITRQGQTERAQDVVVLD
jgi:hypothetical protein